jgi:mannose-6-phosphate isomerase-like protein (cupin superfamily)
METKAIHKSPWGTWEVLEDSELYKVKKIRIDPLQRLSYQKHFKREENWFVVEGAAEVTVDGVELKILVKWKHWFLLRFSVVPTLERMT